MNTTQIVANLMTMGLASSLLISTGCSKARGSGEHESAPLTSTYQQAVPLKRLRIAVIQDKSLSTGTTRTPQLKIDDLGLVLQLLKAHGGELAFGVIHDRSNSSFARLRIDPGPTEPVAPEKAENPLERRKQHVAFTARRSEFNSQRDEWDRETELRIDEFHRSLAPILSMKVDATHSPVWDAVKRAELFLSETDSSNTAIPTRYCVLITDGIDDVGARPVPMSNGTTILIVNGSAELGSLVVVKPKAFESIESAFRYIASKELR